MPDISFNNVTITVDAPSAQEAYDRLCDILGGKDDVEYLTDNYFNHDTGDSGPTSELFGYN